MVPASRAENLRTCVAGPPGRTGDPVLELRYFTIVGSGFFVTFQLKPVPLRTSSAILNDACSGTLSVPFGLSMVFAAATPANASDKAGTRASARLIHPPGSGP